MRFATFAVSLAAVTTIATGAIAQTNFNVELRSHLAIEPCSDISARGDYVFLGRHHDGVDIIDVSDPDNPSVVGSWDHPSLDIRVYDPRPIGANSLILSNETGEGFGAVILDVTNPAAPTSLAELAQPTFPDYVHNIWPYGDHVVLSGYGSVTGNAIVNVSVPSSPTYVTTVGTDIHDNSIVDDVLYCADGFTSCEVYDFSNPAAPALITSFTPNDPDTVYYQHTIYPIRDTGYVITTEEIQSPLDDFFYDQGSIRVWDLNGTPTEVWRWRSENMKSDPNITVHNAYCIGDFIYLSCYQEGLRIFDASDPTEPVEVAFYDTFPQTPGGLFEGNWGVYPFQGDDRIFLSDWQNGFFTVSFNGARKSTISGQVLDANTLAPIEGATVRSLTANRTALSDASGDYVLKTGSGMHAFQVSAEGYTTLDEDVALADLGSLDHDFLLAPTTVDVAGSAPGALAIALHEASPNPFNPTTTLRYDVSEDMAGRALELAIYDVRGSHVRTLVEGGATPGRHSARWDGRSASGLPLASGIYTARLTVGDVTRSQRLILTK